MGQGFWEASGTYPAKFDLITPPESQLRFEIIYLVTINILPGVKPHSEVRCITFMLYSMPCRYTCSCQEIHQPDKWHRAPWRHNHKRWGLNSTPDLWGSLLLGTCTCSHSWVGPRPIGNVWQLCECGRMGQTNELTKGRYLPYFSQFNPSPRLDAGSTRLSLQ